VQGDRRLPLDTTINTLDCRGRDIGVKPNGKLTCK
jgi:hypothetical protein